MSAAPPARISSDPVALLDHTLARAWQAVCDAFDVTAEAPSLQTLFCQTDLERPQQAAEQVLANMISEVVEAVDRFSPWYTRPARAYGLMSIRDGKHRCFKWILAPEARQQWYETLEALALAIEKNSGLIQASLLVSQLALRDLGHKPQVSAQCKCHPPKVIRINQRVLDETAIICDACRQPFTS